MRSFAIRPAPLWLTRCLLGDEDPVRMKLPAPPSELSTASRTASQMGGTSCHSSTTWGLAPTSATAGSASTACLTLARPTRVTLSPNERDVHVFPHHMVPATSTAANVSSSSDSTLSHTLGRYPSGLSAPCFMNGPFVKRSDFRGKLNPVSEYK